MHTKLLIAILSDTAKTWIAVKQFSVKILEHSVNPLLFYVATKYGKRDFVEEMWECRGEKESAEIFCCLSIDVISNYHSRCCVGKTWGILQ